MFNKYPPLGENSGGYEYSEFSFAIQNKTNPDLVFAFKMYNTECGDPGFSIFQIKKEGYKLLESKQANNCEGSYC